MKSSISILIRCVGLFLPLIFFALLPRVAVAHSDYIVDRSVYEDRSASLDWQQAQQKAYTPIGPLLAKGFSKSAFWVRLKIDPYLYDGLQAGTDADKLVVRVLPAYLDEIALFDPLDKSGTPRIAGDRHAWSNSDTISLNYEFLIPRGTEPRYIWLKLKTASSALMYAQVLDVKTKSLVDRVQDLGFGIYIGFLVILFIWTLVALYFQREVLVFIFSVEQFIVLLHALAITGYLRIFLAPYLEPQAIDLTCCIVIISFGFFSALFYYFLYQEFQVYRWVKIFLGVVMLQSLVNFVLLLSGQVMYALQINLYLLLAMAITFSVVPFFGIPWKSLPVPIVSKKTMFIIQFVILFIALLNLLPALGLGGSSQFSPYFGQLYGVVSGMIFLIYMRHRYRFIKEESVYALAMSNAQVLAEKNKRIEQSKFLYMLAHELKTPLSVLKMALGTEGGYAKYRSHIDDAIVDMTNVIDRTISADKLDLMEIEVHPETCDLNQLIRNFAQTHGVEVKEDRFVSLQSDPIILRRILSNLIDNALKYGKSNSPVVVQIQRQMDGEIEYAVIDVINVVGSAGVPDPELAFTKYYRAPQAHERTGSGLGLYLVQNLAKLLDGRVELLTKGNLVIFRIFLPIVDFSTLKR